MIIVKHMKQVHIDKEAKSDNENLIEICGVQSVMNINL